MFYLRDIWAYYGCYWVFDYGIIGLLVVFPFARRLVCAQIHVQPQTVEFASFCTGCHILWSFFCGIRIFPWNQI